VDAQRLQEPGGWQSVHVDGKGTKKTGHTANIIAQEAVV